mgnify:CR=1 FL=1
MREQLNEYKAMRQQSPYRPDLRVRLKVDVCSDQIHYVDQFEWELSADANAPEEFAASVTTELGLGGEFRYVLMTTLLYCLADARGSRTAIAHSIREQVEYYSRMLNTGYMDETRMMPEIASTLRPEQIIDEFTPTLHEISDFELQKLEQSAEREARRKRRQNTRGGRSPPPTLRTPQPHGKGVAESESSGTRRNASVSSG